MPSAGGISAPVIIPLRNNDTVKNLNTLNTSTFVELETETPDCRVYFTTDGSKPNPFQPKIGGREVTFRYKGPFTLRSGKRVLKAIAISRDGLKESNVVTKTFQVEESSNKDDDSSSSSSSDFIGQSDRSKSEKKSSSKKKPPNSKPGNMIARKNSLNTILKPKEAWSTPRSSSAYTYTTPINSNNSVQLPEGPFNPTNYSGTQVNFWGVAPAAIPALNGISMPSNDSSYQLGLMTNKTLQSLDQPRVGIDDLRQIIREEAANVKPKQIIEYKEKEIQFLPESPGNGNWKGQIDHIYAHLLERCKSDQDFRKKFTDAKIGKLNKGDFFEDEDGKFLLSLNFIKTGGSAPKPKPKPKEEPKPKPKEEPKPDPPKPNFKKVVSKINSFPKPEPKPEPKPKVEEKLAEVPKLEKPKQESKQEKQERLKKRDPFFETEGYEAEGTLKPWPTFDSEIDSERLQKAMKGIGTDEKTIIDILGYRNSNQRMDLVKSFKTMFGKDLAEELSSELSGNFSSCCKALCLAPDVYDASEVKRAIKGLGTDEDALIEILCTRTNAQIKAINEAYKKQFNKEMEKDVVDDTSGNFKHLLVSQIQAKRDENQTFDRTAAQDDAQALFKAGEAKWGTDESKFNEILCQRSFAHLRAVFEEYSKLTKKTINESIHSEFSGDIKNSLLTVVQVIQDKPGYFAEKLRKAMKGLGTDDQALVRVVVSRSECDMVQIKKSFETQFKGTMASWIKDDTSGDYKEILLALIGERAPPTATAEEVEASQGQPELEEIEEEKIEREGTLKPFASFDAKSDAEALQKAMKGLGTDEQAIINVLGHRSLSQRLEIVTMFKTMFGKDLISELKSELSGDFSHVITSLCKSSAEQDADELRKAMKGLGTDEDCLIEILCSRSNTQLKQIIEEFQKRHNKKLEESIISETSGNLKRLLVSMLTANRPEGNTVDRKKCRLDAKALFDAGEKKFGTDESRFNVILCSRSFAHLRATFEEYKKLAGKDIVESINSEMSGDLKKGFLTIVECIRNESEYYAKVLHDSMAGLGTKDLCLQRTIVSRCEIDMVQIKQKFEANFKQPLGKFIADDTSGDYRKILLALVAEEQFVKK